GPADRRPVPRGQGAHGRRDHHPRPGLRRGAGLGPPLQRGHRAGDGGPAVLRIADTFRQEHGRTVAILVRSFGDIDLAEEAVQDAFATALESWPRDGVPASPQGWIVTTA